jgi:predicted RNA-binding protein with PIN domain
MRGLIVDGYNVLHSAPRYARLLARDFSAARDRLVDDVASFAAGAWRATVVFDGGGRDGAATESMAGRVTIVHTASGVTADEVIERLARDIREAGGDAVVVTSDATTQWTVLGPGITRMSASEFASEMSAEAAEKAGHDRVGPHRTTLEDRLDAETREGLLRLLAGRERHGPGRGLP